VVVAATPASPSPASPSTEVPKTVLAWENKYSKSYVIPALEIIAYMVVLNQFDQYFVGPKEVYRTGTQSAWRNLTHSWIVDTDPFATNQFLHPYGGSMYYGFARSAGLSFWESLFYSSAGSFIWEIGTASIVYTYLGGTTFGAVEWRGVEADVR